jgi:hypothetical protein
MWHKWGRGLVGAGAALLAIVASSAPVAADAPLDNVFVAGDAGWVATGILADGEDAFEIRADGQTMTWFPQYGSRSGPDGQPETCTSTSQYTCMVEGAPWGALVGMVGDGDPFLIGARATDIGEGESGELMLAVNDYDGTFSDNRGGYAVRVRPSA